MFIAINLSDQLKKKKKGEIKKFSLLIFFKFNNLNINFYVLYI